MYLLSNYAQLRLAFLLLLVSFKSIAGEDHGHDHDSHEPSARQELHQQSDNNESSDEHHDDSELILSEKQQQLAGIVVSTLSKQTVYIQHGAPAEIISNAYTTFLVSAPIQSQVVARFKSMGDTVQRLDKIITLFSQDMATAQSVFLTHNNLWQRLKRMPPQALSNNELNSARIQFEESRDQLAILGMSKQDIENLTNQKNWTLGQYHLYASNDGIVLNDNAPQGSILPIGHALFEISNEDSLWVEARLPANSRSKVKQGETVEVRANQQTYMANVIQSGHSIDPATRTRLIRLSINNTNHELHAGQFAQAYFKEALTEPLFYVPQTALMQSSDGDWIIFLEKSPGVFTQQEVTIENTLDNGYAISGLDDNQNAVIQGAFFLFSETKKSSFDIHNH